MKKSRKGVFWGSMLPWFIGIAILVLMLLVAYLLRDRLGDYAGAIADIFRRGS